MDIAELLKMLLTASNESEAAKAFGPDWREKRRAAEDTHAGSLDDQAMNAVKMKQATGSWDAKLKAAQQLFPELSPEDAMAKVESEGIDLDRQAKKAVIGLHAAQSFRALQPPVPRNPPPPEATESVIGPDGKPVLVKRSESYGKTPYSKPSMTIGSLAANPFNVEDEQGNTRLAVRIKGGGLKFVDEIGGTKVAPGPTVEQRNMEIQAAAVEPAFELVNKSLDTLEQATSGVFGKVGGVVPGTSANYAKTRFQDQAKALLGAIVARQSGEGSRLSDEDRRAYSRAATLVNNMILLPGGVAEARARLRDVEALLTNVIARRRGSGTALGSTAQPTTSGRFKVEVVE